MSQQQLNCYKTFNDLVISILILTTNDMSPTELCYQ